MIYNTGGRGGGIGPILVCAGHASSLSLGNPLAGGFCNLLRWRDPVVWVVRGLKTVFPPQVRVISSFTRWVCTFSAPRSGTFCKRLSLNYSHGGLQSLMHSEGSVRALETVDLRRPRCLGSCLHKGGLCAWDLEPLTTAAACERGKRFFVLLPLLISFSLEFAFQLLFMHREALCPHCQPWLLGLPGNVLYT